MLPVDHIILQYCSRRIMGTVLSMQAGLEKVHPFRYPCSSMSQGWNAIRSGTMYVIWQHTRAIGRYWALFYRLGGEASRSRSGWVGRYLSCNSCCTTSPLPDNFERRSVTSNHVSALDNALYLIRHSPGNEFTRLQKLSPFLQHACCASLHVRMHSIPWRH